MTRGFLRPFSGFFLLAIFTSVHAWAQVQYFAVAGGGYSEPAPLIVAPGSLITVYPEIGKISSPIGASGLPLPTTLGGVYAILLAPSSAGVSSEINVPIVSAFPIDTGCVGLEVAVQCGSVTGFTVQIPFELTPPRGGVMKGSALTLVFTDNPTGQPANTALVGVALQTDAIRIIREGDTLTNPTDQRGSGGLTQGLLPPAITNADGSIVSTINPAKIGETISIWAVGLGLPSSGSVTTGAANPSPPLTTKVSVDFDFRPNAGPSMPWSGAASPGDSHVPGISVPAYFAPGYVGLYQVNVTIPAAPVPLQPCGGIYQSNVTVNIGGLASFDGAGICVSQN